VIATVYDGYATVLDGELVDADVVAGLARTRRAESHDTKSHNAGVQHG
jgi:hypothetical protein